MSEIVEVPELQTTQEEADTHMFLHCAHIAESYQHVVIASVDTDVRALCLSFCYDINIEMFQKCGTAARVLYINISLVAQALGKEVCKCLPALHAFTGCDTISAFANKGKLSALKIVKKEERYRKLFQKLGKEMELTDAVFKEIQAFTCHLYGAMSGIADVNLYRYQLFLAKKGEVESYQLPPCAKTLWKHSLRSILQSGTWHCSLLQFPQIPNPVGFGWALKRVDGKDVLVFDWMDCNPAPVAVMAKLRCTCHRACTAPDCPCISSGFPCSELCSLKTSANQAPDEEELVMCDEEDDVDLEDRDREE